MLSLLDIADMEELNNDLAKTIEEFDFLLQTSQERILGEFFSHLLKKQRITVTILLFAVKSALLAYDNKMLPIVEAIEKSEGVAK